MSFDPFDPSSDKHTIPSLAEQPLFWSDAKVQKFLAESASEIDEATAEYVTTKLESTVAENAALHARVAELEAASERLARCLASNYIIHRSDTHKAACDAALAQWRSTKEASDAWHGSSDVKS